ncbi:MAG: DUF3536 domain-containing protein, partial [bacterium]
MEMERQMQLMYTSCGWFFTELSGIETVQVIKYAARAIQIAELISGKRFEDRFLEDLQQAKSNMAGDQDGAWIYQNFVKPSIVSFSKVVSHFAISSTLEVIKNSQKRHKVHIYNIENLDHHVAEHGAKKLHVGKVKVHSEITLREETIGYALLHNDTIENIKCAARPVQNGWNYDETKDRLLRHFVENQAGFETELTKLWGGSIFTPGDLFYDEREYVADKIVRNQLKEVASCAEEIFNKSHGLIKTFSDLGLALPEEIVQPAKITLSNIILSEVSRLRNEPDITKYEKALDAARAAQSMNIPLNTEKAASIFQKKLERRLIGLLRDFNDENVQKFTALIDLADRLKLKLHQSPIQNHLYAILQKQIVPAIDKLLEQQAPDALYSAVNSILRIAYRLNFNIKIYKDRLKAFEQPMSQDPSYWP